MYDTNKPQVIPISEAEWAEYGQTHSIKLRNRILEAYYYIVKISAKKMQPIYKNHAETEDIINQGVLALIDCIDKYNYTRGTQFDSYASIRIRGSIIDYIRKQDWIPRDVRKRSIELEQADYQLFYELGREPTEEELAERVGISVEKARQIRTETQGFSVLLFEEFLHTNLSGEDDPVFGSPEKSLQKQELNQILADAIDTLSEKERTVVSLYYFEELKQKEIAYVMGLTNSRISQLHASALHKLERHIASYIRV